MDAFDTGTWVDAWLQTRQQQPPKRLLAPGPSPAQIQRYFAAAASAPDHGRLTPWRFVVVSDEARERLGEAFMQALLLREPQATAAQRDEARVKAHRAPFLALAVACLGDAGAAGGDGGDVGAPHERLVSLGAALQCMLLRAHADGFGSGLSSGRSLQSEPLRRLFGLAGHELAVCFIAVGSVREPRPPRPRPDPSSFVSILGAA